MIMLLLASAIFVLFFYLGRKRPVFALVSLAALLPTYLLRFTIFGLPSTMLEFIIWGTFLGSLLWKRRVGEDLIILKLRLQKIKYPLALFFLASIISVFAAPDLYKAIGLWRAFFLEPAMIFLMILAVVSPSSVLPLSKGEEGGGIEKIIFGLSISAFYLSAIAIGQKFFHLPNPFLENVSRTSSVFTQPNMLGLYLGPIIILMLGRLLSPLPLSKGEVGGGWLEKLFYITTIIISFAAIIFAQSAGAVVGVIAGIIIFCFFQNKKISAIAISIILIFLTFYILLFPKNIFVEKLFFGNWSGTVRIQIWKESWTMLKDNWLLGAGIGGYPIKILPYHTSRDWMDVYPMPHNIIFNFWSELGLLGLAAFLWLLEKFGRMCYNLLKFSLPRRGRGGEDLLVITAISAMSVIIIHGLVDVPILKNDLSILFWIIYSIPLINNK